MNPMDKFNAGAGQPREWDALESELEPELRQSLSDFKASVHAWSDAALNRPRTVTTPPARSAWRMAAVWALAAVLLAVAVSGGLYERHQRQHEAQIAAQRAAGQQRGQAAQQAVSSEDLLANVDSDISREVPSALEPLASLMTDNGNQ